VTQVDDVLTGWQRSDFEAAGIRRDTYRRGTGPAVIVVHEIPGITPKVVDFANEVVERGFTVVMPDLVGAAGKSPSPTYIATSMAKICIAREFTTMATNQTSPVIAWLRALARHVHEERGGPGVAAVGLCLTGNFAWSVAVDPSVAAAVAGEPALPFNAAGSVHLQPEEAEALQRREGLEVMALRFSGDPSCKAERFTALEQLLGEKLVTRVLPDTAKNPSGNPFPHAVLTKDLIAADGEPTFEAAREVLQFLTRRLKA
jgi:dienelactone hydrolase